MRHANLPPMVLRPMRAEDIQAIHDLDRLAFPSPWPIGTYHHEIRNQNSRLFVLECPSLSAAAEGGIRAAKIIQRLLRRETAGAEEDRSLFTGYSGMWHVADEAHISTIAVHPDWQGNKLGELLLWNMARHAYAVQAAMVTLEVRVTNSVAQGLYRKYGFEIVGRRKGYYRDNGEDAYLMTVKPLDDAYRHWLTAQGRRLIATLPVRDQADPASH